MKKVLVMAVLLVAASFIAMSCGGNSQDKKAPVYPACESSDQCSDHGEVCVANKCVECAKCDDCKGKGPCMACTNNKCQKKADCCTTDKDCSGGKVCKAKPGRKEGTCLAK